MIELNETQVYFFFFVLLRVTSVMIFLPILGDRSIPPMVKILFGLALAFVVTPTLWGQGATSKLDVTILESPSRTIWLAITEVMFGALIGFIARWVFDAVQFAGHFAGNSMGFSIATVLDPHSEMQTIALAEMQYILSALLFLLMDGHHVYLNAILSSFDVLPLGKVDLLTRSEGVVQYLIQMSAQVMSLGLKLAAPVLVVVLISNIAFSMLARAVSQMNVLVISFTANLVIGFVVILVTLPGFMNMVETAFESSVPELVKFMRLFGG